MVLVGFKLDGMDRYQPKLKSIALCVAAKSSEEFVPDSYQEVSNVIPIDPVCFGCQEMKSQC